MPHLIHKELSYQVRGALLEVYNQLGPSLPESFYRDALTYGLRERGIACEPEKHFDVLYSNTTIGTHYIDLWLETGKLLLELKVAPRLLPIHQAQTISYLKLTNADLAILANFGTPSLQDQRLPNFIRDKPIDFQWQPPPPRSDILYPDLTNRLLETLHRVHFTLGPGFIHRIYRQAVMVELQHQGLNYELIRDILVHYHHHFLGIQPAQLIKVENQVVLGVFAEKAREKVMTVDMKARLKRLGMQMGMLGNFYGERVVVEVVRGN
jgi:GxxExxY protein